MSFVFKKLGILDAGIRPARVHTHTSLRGTCRVFACLDFQRGGGYTE